MIMMRQCVCERIYKVKDGTVLKKFCMYLYEGVYSKNGLFFVKPVSFFFELSRFKDFSSSISQCIHIRLASFLSIILLLFECLYLKTCG